MTDETHSHSYIDVEHHLSHRIGWLRAAVLGANDGIVSTGSLLVGVAAAAAGKPALMLAGTAALVAGAMSMAAGEYVSVSSQRDTEAADLKVEAVALRDNPDMELRELAGIYRKRGLSKDLALQVAQQLTEHDALGAHARDELGFSPDALAQPVQAAWTSALSFTLGAALPLAAAYFAPVDKTIPIVATASLIALAILGLLSAKAGGVGPLRPLARILFWGAAAMVATALIGHAFGVGIA